MHKHMFQTLDYTGGVKRHPSAGKPRCEHDCAAPFLPECGVEIAPWVYCTWRDGLVWGMIPTIHQCYNSWVQGRVLVVEAVARHEQTITIFQYAVDVAL
jgi:hypothetical protein